jgi:hypothetical protein
MIPASVLQRRAAWTLQLLEHARIIRGIHHHHDVAEVLPCRAQQRRATDVDLLH